MLLNNDLILYFYFYIITLVILTIFKNKITFKGIFYIIIFILSLFIIIILYNIPILLVKNWKIYYKLTLLNNSWLFLDISFSLHVDTITYLFSLLVLIIGFSTNIYILDYFKYEANIENFILLINWFICSMIILVMASNFFTLYLGWELIGLTSFYLINFWYNRFGTFKSSFKAWFFNKISDVFLLLFLIICQRAFLTTDLEVLMFLLKINTYYYINELWWAGIFLIICSSLKSAQIIGHLWLPDSMEAPVPASSLIHSATLVSAGIYLLLRFFPLLEYLNLLTLIVYIGSITASFGGIVAASQTDVKKILAYSTISHCGFLFITIGLTSIYTTIVYLYFHGLFKAMTFYCVGTFIRITNTQEIRHMGIINKYTILYTLLLLFTSFNLGGLPLTFGYIYKSLFFNSIFFYKTPILCIGFIYIGLLTSIIYTFKLNFYTSWDYLKSNIPHSNIYLQTVNLNIKKNWTLTTPVHLIAVLILTLFSLVFYIIIQELLLFSSISFDVYPIQFIGYIDEIMYINNLYNLHFYLFYLFYLLLCIVILYNVLRKESTYKKKILFSLYLFINLIFNIYYIIF